MFKFIRWWWNKMDGPSKWVFVLASAIVLCTVGCFVWGIKALMVFSWLLIAYIAGTGIYFFGKSIKEHWDHFKYEQEEEAQRIVDALSGDRTWSTLQRTRKR